MQFLIKIIVSIVIIVGATAVAKRLPALAGLIAVMPLAGALILVWVYLENSGDAAVMGSFTKGALWGILPSILFYVVALYCFKRGFSLTMTLGASFAAWAVAALVHQCLIK